jgi:formate hydrogenlyase subunit 3/multisubunit Na+/H+ antiporter MnhD subunit
MGLMTAGLGASLAAPQAWPMMLAGVTIFALHHALAKAALFLGLGVARAAKANQMRLVGIGLLLPALALAGLPGTSGWLAKAMLKTGAAAAGAWGGWLYAALPWSALATTLLLSRFLWLAWPTHAAQTKGAPCGIWIPWSVLLLAVAGALWWFPDTEVEKLGTRENLLDSSWPVALGALVATLVAWLSDRSRFRLPVAVPAGDLLVPVSYVAKHLVRAGNWFADKWLPRQRRRLLMLLQTERDLAASVLAASRMEARLTRWGVGIGVYLLLAIILAAILFAQP